MIMKYVNIWGNWVKHTQELCVQFFYLFFTIKNYSKIKRLKQFYECIYYLYAALLLYTPSPLLYFNLNVFLIKVKLGLLTYLKPNCIN